MCLIVEQSFDMLNIANLAYLACISHSALTQNIESLIVQQSLDMYNVHVQPVVFELQV